MEQPVDHLLLLLKSRGPQLTADLARHIGVTRQAARMHLTALAAEGLVEPKAARFGGWTAETFLGLDGQG